MVFDWAGLSNALACEIVSTVRSFLTDDGSVYGVAVFGFYSDGDTIAWPTIGVGLDGTAQADDRELRWLPYDWDHVCYHSDIGDEWSAKLSAHASADRGKRFEAVEKRFYTTVVNSCKAARKVLLAEGLIRKSALVIAIDDGEELVRKCLTPAQLLREFPRLAAEQTEINRIAALPASKQISELLDSMQHDGRLLNSEAALPLLYAIAVDHREEVIDALMSRLTVDPGAEYESPFIWISALSDLGADRPDVIATLLQLLLDPTQSESVHIWSSSTLCRLGHLPLVAAHIDELPPGLRGCFATPYIKPLPGRIDFGPLEAVLAAYPPLDDVMLSALGLNHDVTGDRVDTYFAALSSSWASIRHHAACSLVFADLTHAELRRLRAELGVLEADPSPAVAGIVQDLRTKIDSEV